MYGLCMDTSSTPQRFTVYQQATTGMLHRRKSCSITARTRYDHFESQMTLEQLERHLRVMKPGKAFCSKCWNDFAGIAWDADEASHAVAKQAEQLDAPSFEWTYTKVQTLLDSQNFEKWTLHRGANHLATVVRVPGSKTRIYWPDGTLEDHPSPAFAELAIRNRHPQAPAEMQGLSDADRERARDFASMRGLNAFPGGRR